jgi:histone H3/H4
MEGEEEAEVSLPEFKVRDKTVEEICRLSFREDKTKMSSDSVRLTKETIKVFVAEALTRAAEQAKLEGAKEVKGEHLEKILPQFLLDFS